MYFFIQNSEDGLRVSVYDYDAALAHIKDLTSQDVRPECRAVFVDAPPTEYSDERDVFIIKGDPVIPLGRERVVEWEL